MTADIMRARLWAHFSLKDTRITPEVRNAARFILENTELPTMDHIRWEDDIHRLMEAETEDGDLVVMLTPIERAYAATIMTITPGGTVEEIPRACLTPTGQKYQLVRAGLMDSMEIA